MARRITPRQHRPEPWRNGLGVTAAIAASARTRPDGAPAWSLSLARMTGPADFSDWGGWLRVLTVVEGPGLRLVWPEGSPEGARVAAALRPCAFPGAPAPRGTPLGAVAANLNLIADPDLGAHVRPLRLLGAVTLRRPAGREAALYVARGRVSAGGRLLRAGDALALGGESRLRVAPLGGPAKAVWVVA